MESRPVPATPDKAVDSSGSFRTPEQKSQTDVPSDSQTTEFMKKHPELAHAAGAHLIHKKRLEKGHKYFDSGDYNMARAKSKKEGVVIGPTFTELEALDATGEDHPTPESIPHKKYPPAPETSKLTL